LKKKIHTTVMQKVALLVVGVALLFASALAAGTGTALRALASPRALIPKGSVAENVWVTMTGKVAVADLVKSRSLHGVYGVRESRVALMSLPPHEAMVLGGELVRAPS